MLNGKDEEVPEVLWVPPTNKTNMDDFRTYINNQYRLNLENYHSLYVWSVENYVLFWEELWKYLNVIHHGQYTQIVDSHKRIDEIPEWFHGVQLNYAENLLSNGNDNDIAIYSIREGTDEVGKLTFKELRSNVAGFAAALRKLGIKKHDVVAGYLPNCAEAIEAMLATASIGAIWSSASPDFGVAGVLDRFIQIKPRVLFSVDAVVYNGKVHNNFEKLSEVVKSLPDVEQVILIPFCKTSINLHQIPRCISLEEFLKLGLDSDGNLQPLAFNHVPFNHPLFIMFSSGTTGPPKCMVHSAGGTLIKHMKEHVLHSNMTRNDILLYFTSTGWMMWNWMVSSLAVGSSIVLYDGSPLYPQPDSIFDYVDQLGITILGTGAKWLSVLESKGIEPKKTHKLNMLHTILSTGSPLSLSSFDYVYRSIKSNVLLGSITGGTDLIACFAGVNPTIPVHRGEIQSRHLGMAVESWNEKGKAVWGESGELVCTKPFPSMPTHFWNDTDGSKYHGAYFSKFKGIWCHGDYCKLNPKTGGIFMLGRSDGTLNPNGIRFGSAEIYSHVEQLKEVQDSLCVAQSNSNGEERVVLFLKMVPGCPFTPDFVKRVQNVIRMELSARHVPSVILSTRDIPYTASGKKVEVAVRKIISGQEVTNRGALINPDSLDLYHNIPELSSYLP